MGIRDHQMCTAKKQTGKTICTQDWPGLHPASRVWSCRSRTNEGRGLLYAETRAPKLTDLNGLQLRVVVLLLQEADECRVGRLLRPHALPHRLRPARGPQEEKAGQEVSGQGS